MIIMAWRAASLLSLLMCSALWLPTVLVMVNSHSLNSSTFQLNLHFVDKQLFFVDKKSKNRHCILRGCFFCAKFAIQ